MNALDDDHREGIASVLLEDPLLKDRQQILTCHGEVFINKLASKIGESGMAKKVHEYRFRPANQAKEPGVQIREGKPSHYIGRANQAYDDNSMKDAAAQCRRAVESLSESLWKKLNSNLKLSLTVSMRQPGAPPDLNSVVNGLKAAVKDVKLPESSTLKADLGTLTTKYVNVLLNKGTHHQDDLPEFERPDTKLLINLVQRMDKEILELKFGAIGVAPTAAKA